MKFFDKIAKSVGDTKHDDAKLHNKEETHKLMELLSDLVDASHILHHYEVLDGFGHVSARFPLNPNVFIMSVSIAPALATHEHLAYWKVEDGSLVSLAIPPEKQGDESPPVPKGFLERFIHSEIYKKFPNVNAIVHGHTLEVLPFANSKATSELLRAKMHTSGFLGTGPNVFTSKEYTQGIKEGDPDDTLIRNCELGASLAAKFDDSPSEVVLMQHHGFVVRAPSLRCAVYRAYYTKQSAVVALHSATLTHAVNPFEEVDGLTASQIKSCMATNESEAILNRSWDLWVKRVNHTGFYENKMKIYAQEVEEKEKKEKS